MGSRFGLEVLMFSAVWLDLSRASTLSSDLFIFPGLGAQGEFQVAVVYKVEVFKTDVITKLSGHGLVIGGSVVRFVISAS